MTHEFTPTGKEGAVSTLITVRHLPSGEERSTVVTPEEVIGQDWGEVAWINVAILRASLGYVEPEHYSFDEFRIDTIRDRDPLGNVNCSMRITHSPSGMQSATIDLGEAKQNGKSQVAVREELMQGLIRALNAAGIKPQHKSKPVVIARKKLGKPRWKDKAPKDGEQA